MQLALDCIVLPFVIIQMWNREEFEDWLQQNKWYIAGGVIFAIGTGAVIGYLLTGGTIALVGKAGALKVIGALTLSALGGYAVAKVPYAITQENKPDGTTKWGIFTGDAAKERAKRF